MSRSNVLPAFAEESKGSVTAYPTRESFPMDEQTSHPGNIKRWDGMARACARWDHLRKDPELWDKDGNCFVHLYPKGQSRRGPAFRVPLGRLVLSGCQPMLRRYLAQHVPQIVAPTSKYANPDVLWARASAIGRVDLYVAPPPSADVDQAFRCRLAVRNFIAWVCGRPMVGEHLGSALIGLVDSMSEFRRLDADAVRDTILYLDDEGYLHMTNQPVHALAVLHLAEHFRLRSLYIDAFAHCVGMGGERLYPHPEYQCLSLATRRLIHNTRTALDAKLRSARLLLGNFLREDLTASTLGLEPAAPGLAHLERFRAFLVAFYTAELGGYPPPPVGSMSDAWDADVYARMSADFEALYDLLVNRAVWNAAGGQPLPEGSADVLKSVAAFDQRHGYAPRAQQLPLLPALPVASSAGHSGGRRGRGLLWFVKTDKLRPDQRLVAHAALVKATNNGAAAAGGERDWPENALVAAYRQFEEAFSSANFAPRRKNTRDGPASQAEARKLRWVLVYAVAQILRDCVRPPPDVRYFHGAAYCLGIPTHRIPPWPTSDDGRPAPGSSVSTNSSGESLPPSPWLSVPLPRRPKSTVFRPPPSSPPKPTPAPRAVTTAFEAFRTAAALQSASTLVAAHDAVGTELDRPPPTVRLTDPRSTAKSSSRKPSSPSSSSFPLSFRPPSLRAPSFRSFRPPSFPSSPQLSTLTTATTAVPPRQGAPSRSKSIMKRLSRVGTVRHSIAWFRNHTGGGDNTRKATPSPPQQPPPHYQEIVVDGYGNGTNSTHSLLRHDDQDHRRDSRRRRNRHHPLFFHPPHPPAASAGTSSSPSSFHSASSTIERERDGPSSSITTTPDAEFVSASIGSSNLVQDEGKKDRKKDGKMRASSIDTVLHRPSAQKQRMPEQEVPQKLPQKFPGWPPSPRLPMSSSSSVYSTDGAGLPPSGDELGRVDLAGLETGLGLDLDLDLELSEVHRRFGRVRPVAAATPEGHASPPPAIPQRSPARHSLVMTAIPEAGGMPAMRPSPLRIRKEEA